MVDLDGAEGVRIAPFLRGSEVDLHGRRAASVAREVLPRCCFRPESAQGTIYDLPHTLFVAERGLEHFDLSMRAQYELTKRFSAEISIRPYIVRDPERTVAIPSPTMPSMPRT
jgi:hypothetical protein